MNEDCIINDTFDNFSFSESGRLWNKSHNFNAVINSESLHGSKINGLLNSTNKTTCNPIKLEIKHAEPEIDYNISVDDSIFLNDFLTICERNISCEGNNTDDKIKESEELFPDESEKTACNSSYNNDLNTHNSQQNNSNITLKNSLNNNSNITLKSQTDHRTNNYDNLNDIESTKRYTNIPEEIHENKDNISVLRSSQLEEDGVKSPSTKSVLSYSCSLLAWGLPDLVLQKYAKRGIVSMFPWQAECLGNANLLQNRANLVYSAPTSAGKTLVAEILTIKTVIEYRKKVLFILPFVSVVREKMFYFQDILGGSGVRVEGFMGSHNPPGGFQAVQVAICTIEKANGIINRLLEDGSLGDIGAVIVDEMHLLGDPSRGYLLELMLTKLLYMTMRYDKIQIQIIGMSATLPNLNLLGKWLKAELYVTDFRPIPLLEQCLLEGEIYNKALQLERRLSNLPELDTDSDNILQLCLETIQNSCSVLIFCPTKNWCENLSQQIAMAFWKLGCSKSDFGVVLREQLKCDLISELLEQLRRCPVGLDKILQKTVSYGAAFHHAGLTMDERDIIEAAFRNGALRVLVATSTLSSGVNLPARRVIIRTPMFHRKPLDSLVYRQMIGRAGRMGKDSCGESILICQKGDCGIAKELLSAELAPIESCLEGSGRLKRAILEVIASGVAATPDDVQLFTNCTLLAVTEKESENALSSPIEEAIDFLCRNEFIRLQRLDGGNLKYVPTSLGKACLSSSMPPEEGLALFAELEKARQCFVLENELHLIYVVTPYSVCNQWGNLDWMLFLELWEKLPSSMKRVGELVGVRESYLISGTRNKIQTNTTKLYQKLQVHRRFFTALALQDLVNEVPLNEVAAKFGCSRGMLQSLQQSASTFAGMLTIFSRQLGWSSMEILISQFQDRLHFGISRDLLDLMRLSILNGPRARALYNAGIETLAHLASSDVCAVENILHKVVPFESEKERDGESEFDAQQRNKIRGIWVTGKEGLTEREAAVMLVQDARRYLQLELGLAEAKWDTNTSDGNSTQQIHKTEDMNNSLPKTVESNKDTSHEDIENSSNSNEKNCKDHEKEELNASFELKLSPESPNINHSSKNFTDSSAQFNKINVESASLKINTDEGLTNGVINSSDQSLFEESFELNRQLASWTISTETSPAFDEHQEIGNENSLSNNLNSGDSGLDFDNGSFLENAFVSSFNIESESLDKSDDVVTNSPEFSSVNKMLSKRISSNITENSHNFDSAKSVLTQLCRKRDRLDKEYAYKSSIVDEDESMFIEQTPTKKRKTHTFQRFESDTNAALQDCTNILNANLENYAAVDLTKLHMIDVCNNRNLYETFSSELFQQHAISLSFACSGSIEDKLLIGANVVGTNILKNTTSTKQMIYKGRHVLGLAVTWGGNVAYYISFINTALISNTEKTDLLQKLFNNGALEVKIFDCKEQVKVAKLHCNLDFHCAAEDPKVGDWLMEPEGKEKNLQAMALKYAPEVVNLSQLARNCKGVGSVGLDLHSTVDPRTRAAVEAIVTWHLCKPVLDALSEQNSKLLQTYKTEMSSILCLARMELNGIGVDTAQLQTLVDSLKEQIGCLETQAYALAGRHFSFTSSTDVAKVLRMHRGRKVSTSKQILEQQDHPVAKLVLQWRKLSSTLTKMMYPLIRSIENNRIHGCCVTHSSTGRISMHEPNLQNIPRDFEIENQYSKNVVKCRMAFVPASSSVFLSADYCQLELRLLAHLSQDPSLCSIMRSDEDVFKSVASQWKAIQKAEVSDELRQWAKRLCYGIIYGMGAKTLAEQLSVSEEDALKFCESFQNCFPCIRKYIEGTINNCRDLGYVETVAGRKRYLPHINHQQPAVKSQAERQAVNTTVQGSAADIAKIAMVLIESRFQNKFRHKKNLPKLVLHLHDELLYEVQKKYLVKTASILKETMETAWSLSVPLPVKLKSGLSWGAMTELTI